MNSTNYVAFSFAALFDRVSARAAPRRVIIPCREEEGLPARNNGRRVPSDEQIRKNVGTNCDTYRTYIYTV